MSRCYLLSLEAGRFTLRAFAAPLALFTVNQELWTVERSVTEADAILKQLAEELFAEAMTAIVEEARASDAAQSNGHGQSLRAAEAGLSSLSLWQRVGRWLRTRS